MIKWFDVAISYSREDGDEAEKFYIYLSKKGFSVFFDRKEAATMQKGNFESNLADVFKEKSRFCLVLLSKHYLENGGWCSDELAWMKTRRRKEGAKSEFIILVSLDGIPSSEFHLDEIMPFLFEEDDFEEVVEELCTIIGDPLQK